MRRKHWPRHGGLGLGLGVGGGGVGYLLNDSFTNDVAAGAFAGANLLAVPGPGTRKVTDGAGSGTAAISGGELIITGENSQYDPGLWYGAVSRVTGTIILAKTKQSLAAASPYNLILSANQNTGIPSANGCQTANSILARTNGASVTIGPAVTVDTYGYIGLIVKANGCYFYYKSNQFSKWSLLYISIPTDYSTNPFYPSVSLYTTGQTLTSDFIRVPTMLWTPQPISADAFGGTWPTTDGGGLTGLEAGGSGKTWTTAVGATWSNSGGFAINAPVGVEKVVDVPLNVPASWGDGGIWTLTGTSATLNVPGSTNFCYNSPSYTSVIGNYYRCEIELSGMGGVGGVYVSPGKDTPTWSTDGTYISVVKAILDRHMRFANNNAGIIVTVESCSIKELTTAELIQVIDNGVNDFYAEIDITAAAGFQAGIVFNYVDSSNFEVVYLNRNDAKIYWDKCVAGTYTNMSNTAFTYAAAAKLAVRKIGTAVYIWYNNAYVHNNTSTSGLTGEKQGLFSTGNGATEVKFANWKLYAVGSGGEYSLLDMFCN